MKEKFTEKHRSWLAGKIQLDFMTKKAAFVLNWLWILG